MEKPTFPMNRRWLVVYGDPVDGFEFYGTFNSHEEAVSWAESSLDSPWWIAKLQLP